MAKKKTKTELKRERQQKAVLKAAPQCTTLEEVCLRAKVPKASLYRQFKRDPQFKVETLAVLGSRYSETETLDGTEEYDMISSSGRKSKKQRRRGIEQRIDLKKIRQDDSAAKARFRDNEHRIETARKVCKLIEEGGLSLRAACEAIGFGLSTMWNWMTPTHYNYVPGVREMYEEARRSFDLTTDEEIRFLARSALLKRLESRKIKTVTREGKLQADGSISTEKVRQQEKDYEPDTNTIRFALSKLNSRVYGEYYDKQMSEDKGEENNYDLRNLTLRQIQERKEMLIQQLQASTGQGEAVSEEEDEEL